MAFASSCSCAENHCTLASRSVLTTLRWSNTCCDSTANEPFRDVVDWRVIARVDSAHG